MKQSGSWYYYLADGLGSTMAVVDASGTVQDSYTYDVYGTPSKTGSLANEFDFAGQQTDGTGLQYLRARYYDPATGTFLSREPLAIYPRCIGNLFSYSAGRVVNGYDPTGRQPTIDGDGSPSDPCNGLIIPRILDRIKELLTRIQEYQNPKYDLPETGRMSRQSHRDEFTAKQKNLQNWIQRYFDDDCNDGDPRTILDGIELSEYKNHRLDNAGEWLDPAISGRYPLPASTDPSGDGGSTPPVPWFIPITPPSRWIPEGLCQPAGGGWSPCYAAQIGRPPIANTLEKSAMDA
ncbi:MAG: hypothetical protein IT301_04090 [Dehalococcoidia bacterium]|nr:hypothetical protein [Dehalococcoidia bacterium]